LPHDAKVSVSTRLEPLSLDSLGTSADRHRQLTAPMFDPFGARR
jgi:hypothetical protein